MNCAATKFLDEANSLASSFERAVYAHSYPAAVQQMLGILSRIETHPEEFHFAESVAGPLYTRLASAAGALLADPKFSPDPAAFEHLTSLNRVLWALFGASAFGGSAHLPALMGRATGKGQSVVQGAAALRKLLPIMHPDMAGIDLPGSISRLAPDLAVPALLGLLRNRFILTPRGEAARGELLAASDLLDRVRLSQTWIKHSQSVWMFSSYAEAAHKHRIKAALNRSYRGHLERLGLRDLAIRNPRAQPDKPTLLVMGERFKSGHAMMRCYGPFIDQLRRRFRTVLMSRSGERDAAASAHFDECVTALEDPRKNASAVGALAPDVIFYPSLGMSSWAVLLANLRLAPIQCMSIGHPASSFSPAMDYLLLGRDVAGDPSRYSERAIVLASQGALFAPHERDPELEPARGAPGGVFEIAVPARSMKISSRLLEACRRIGAGAGRPVRFHFFPGSLGPEWFAASRAIRAMLPGSAVHPNRTYADYMQLLRACHLALAPFPFGNANGTVDCALLRVPVVAMDGGVEPHERTDRRVLRAVGAPDWLLANGAQAYAAAALRLIREEPLRAKVAESLAGARERLFEADHRAHPDDFVDTMWWLFRHHEKVQADSRRIWWPEDRTAPA